MIKLNGYEIKPTIFPDGTSQVWKLPEELLEENSRVQITWDFTHEGELFHLMQLKSLLESKSINADLYLPYLPYGRQDKGISNESTFALSTFAYTLMTLDFDQIIIDDPHSDYLELTLGNIVPNYPIKQVNYLFDILEADFLCYPDDGAKKKYTKIYDKPYIFGYKERDQLTGNILNYFIGHKWQDKLQDKKILICDDICDGGGTFILLAKELFKKGVKEVNLFTTHGLYSKGLKPIFESGIKRIFNKNGEVTEFMNNILIDKEIYQ